MFKPPLSLLPPCSDVLLIALFYGIQKKLSVKNMFKVLIQRELFYWLLYFRVFLRMLSGKIWKLGAIAYIFHMECIHQTNTSWPVQSPLSWLVFFSQNLSSSWVVPSLSRAVVALGSCCFLSRWRPEVASVLTAMGARNTPAKMKNTNNLSKHMFKKMVGLIRR